MSQSTNLLQLAVASIFGAGLLFGNPGYLSAASLDLAVEGFGVSVGDSERIKGLRINLIDRRLERVEGVCVSLMSAGSTPRGEVNGVAIGAANGLRRLRGVGVGLVGIAIGGTGVGEDHAAPGGFDAAGLTLGGLGSAVGGSMMGVSMAGIGVDVGKDATGILLGGVGVGVGRRFSGIAGALGGVKVGERLQGIAAGGLMVTAKDVHGVTVGILNGTRLHGFALRNVNDHHRGLAIGGINFTRKLEGVQIGLLNYAGNNPRWARLLPVINVHR